MLWLLTAEGLYQVEKDRLSAVPIPMTDGAVARAMSADGAELVVASLLNEETIGVVASHDGGATWSSKSPINVRTNAGIGAVHIAIKGSAIVVLAIEATSSNASQARTATSDDGGETWEIHRAPAGGGVIAAGGSFWFVGGLGGDEVAKSKTGADWVDVAVPVKATAWSASLPSDLGSGTLAMAATSHTADASEVTFWTTSDGGTTWQASGSVAAPQTEVGVAVPTVIRADGRWTAIWPDGSKVLNGRLSGNAEPNVISPNGLPQNVIAIGSAQGALFALAATDDCTSNKSACTSSEMVLSSQDNGQTWTWLP